MKSSPSPLEVPSGLISCHIPHRRKSATITYDSVLDQLGSGSSDRACANVLSPRLPGRYWLVLPTVEGEPCLYSTQIRKLWPPSSGTPASMRPRWQRQHFLQGTTGVRSMAIATTCRRSSSGPPTPTSPSWRRSDPHIELYPTAMEQKGLAPSTIDRRLSTVCGFYRFALIDGRVNANPAQYVRRPKVHPSKGRGLDRREFGTSSSRPSVSIRAMPLWPCSSASTGFGSVRHVEPISRISTSPRDTGPSGSWEKEASLRWFPSSPPLGALHRQAGRAQCRLPAHAPLGIHHGRTRCRGFPP